MEIFGCFDLDLVISGNTFFLSGNTFCSKLA